MNKELWLTGFSFVPVALVGYLLGTQVRSWVDERFRPLLLVLFSISALIALYGAIF